MRAWGQRRSTSEAAASRIHVFVFGPAASHGATVPTKAQPGGCLSSTYACSLVPYPLANAALL